MAVPARSTGFLARSAASPRLRPILVALTALSLVTGAGQAIALSPTTSAADPAPARATVAAAPEMKAATQASPAELAPTALTAPVRVTVVPRPQTVPVAPVAKRKAKTTTRASSPTRTVTHRATSTATVYRGANHVWIPALGISRSVSWFPCSRTTDPANYVYRWGCAGANNVYLLGHAWGVFKPLHDAYYNGRLRTGMKVVYGDAAGRVHTYSVIWWRVVAPTTAASWAWASLSRPSMTLQTCVGSGGKYRLMVRLVQVA